MVEKRDVYFLSTTVKVRVMTLDGHAADRETVSCSSLQCVHEESLVCSYRSMETLQRKCADYLIDRSRSAK